MFRDGELGSPENAFYQSGLAAGICFTFAGMFCGETPFQSGVCISVLPVVAQGLAKYDMTSVFGTTRRTDIKMVRKTTGWSSESFAAGAPNRPDVRIPAKLI